MTLTSRQERRLVAVGLVALWAAWFAPQLFSSGVPFRRDTLLLYLPIRTFLHEQLLSMRLPQWFPYEGLGVPFIGQFVTATFHPESWLLLPLSPAMALKANILGAYLLALIGGYRFSRTFDVQRSAAACGGAALAFSGYALSMSDNLPFLVGLATLPWVGWAAMKLALKRRAVDAGLLAVTWALVLLAGDVQAFVLAAPLVLACLVAGRASTRAMLLSSVAFLLALGLAAVELFPASGVFGGSTRLNSGFVIDPATYWALRLRRLPEFFIPHFVPSAALSEARELLYGESFQWSVTIFAGGLVLLMVLAGLTTRVRGAVVFIALAGFALWMATGGAGHLLPLVWKVLPPLASFRFPEKYLGLFGVALVPVVALGAAAMLADRRRWAFGAVSASFVSLLLALVVRAEGFIARLSGWLSGANPNEALTEQISLGWSAGLRTTALFLCVAALLLWLLARWSWSAALLPLVVAGELWFGNSSALPLVPGEMLNPPASPFAKALALDPKQGPIRLVSTARPRPESADDTEAHRRWTHNALSLLKPDVAALFQASTIGASALPGQSERTRAVLGQMGVRAPQLAGLFGACVRVVDDAGPTPPPGAIWRDLETGVALVRGKGCRDAAYFAQAVKAGPMDQLGAAVAGLSADDVDVVWDGPATPAPMVYGLDWKSWAPGHFQLEAEGSEAGALVVSEGFSEGWQAKVDGAVQTVFATNGIAMGVRLAAGKHTVDFVYATPRLLEGAGVSLLSLLICLWLLTRRRVDPESLGSAELLRS